MKHVTITLLSRNRHQHATGPSADRVKPATPGRVRCLLRIACTNLPVEIPDEILERHRLLTWDDVVLRVAGEPPVPVRFAPLLSDTQQAVADGWMAEMEAFDRF